MRPTGIEPAIFRLVPYCLKQLRHQQRATKYQAQHVKFVAEGVQVQKPSSPAGYDFINVPSYSFIITACYTKLTPEA
jgi:hypothetical protein